MPLGEVLGLVLAAPEDVSPFLERLFPELLSAALFLQAARPISGTMAIMASNVFNDINSPPFFGFDCSRTAAFFTFSSGAGWVNADVYWIQVNLRLSADAPIAVTARRGSSSPATAATAPGLIYPRCPSMFGSIRPALSAELSRCFRRARSCR
ncbi:MAG TPA: hypothetical protein VGH16_13415 [Candidatus Binatia bacterium]